jgi:hypothetical protein
MVYAITSLTSRSLVSGPSMPEEMAANDDPVANHSLTEAEVTASANFWE